MLGLSCLSPFSLCIESKMPAHGLGVPVFGVDIPSTKSLWKKTQTYPTHPCASLMLRGFFSPVRLTV